MEREKEREKREGGPESFEEISQEREEKGCERPYG